MKQVKVKLPTEFNLFPAIILGYDKEFKEVLVEIQGPWRFKQKHTVMLDEVYLVDE